MTPWDGGKIKDSLKRYDLVPDMIDFVISTHGHADHVLATSAGASYSQSRIELAVPSLLLPPEVSLYEGDPTEKFTHALAL